MLKLRLRPHGEYVIKDGDMLGRHHSCNHIFRNADISRQHCVFNKRDSEWWVRDLNSMNGTFVNEDDAVDYPLCNGDTLRVASLTFEVIINES